MHIDAIVDFASATTPAERYSPTPEKVLSGQPTQAVCNHYSSPCAQFHAGVWDGEPGKWLVNYTEHEYCEITHGVSVIRDNDGNARTVRVGDRFVIPAGFRGSWEVLEACRKVYVLFEAREQ